MIYQGSFKDIQNRTVTVRIESGTGTNVTEIGASSSGLLFADNPVETNHAYNDQFDVIMRESCTIRLLSTGALTQLYSRDVLENKVTVKRGTEVIFKGYVEPQAFSQPFNSRYDEIELSCIDIFSAMKYLLWEGVSRVDVDYSQKKSEATQMSVGAILAKCLGAVAPDLNRAYIGIPAVDDNGQVSVMQGLYIDTVVFFGDDEESTWTLLDIVESLLQYLNLRMCLYGGAIRMYHPDKLGTGAAVSIDRTTTWDKNHQMEVSETYNKLSLTVDRDTVETVLPDILDDETLERVYSGRQLWCSEYMAPSLYDMFYTMDLLDKEQPCRHARRKDHYIRVLNSPGWTFGGLTSNGTHLNDYMAYYNPDTHSQEMGFNDLRNRLGAMLVEIATGEQRYGLEDNSVSSELSVDKYLVIGVDGLTEDVKHDTAMIADSYAVKLFPAMPVAEYTGASVQLSPADESTQRYVVFSGNMRLNPVHIPVAKISDMIKQTKIFGKTEFEDKFLKEVLDKSKTDAQKAAYTWAAGKFNAMKVPDAVAYDKIGKGIGAPASCDTSVLKNVYKDWPMSLMYVLLRNVLWTSLVEKYDKDTNGEEEKDHKRYYVRRYWHCDTPDSTPEAMTDDLAPNYGQYPVEDDEVYSNLEYKYSSAGGDNGVSIDEVSQLPLLQCMLIVGNKCVVQTGVPKRSEDRIDCYKWQTYKTRAQCASDDEYYQQSFTLGIDIKIKDKIIGPEYDIANNISYKLGLDVKGTAIPVLKSDNVSGEVTFRILGPFNALWKDILRRAPTFWRHVQWTENMVVLLNHISSIWIKDFSVKIKTKESNDIEDGDLVYSSDTDETFVNKKDDLTFRFATGLTAEERKLLKVPDAVCRNTPVNSLTGNSLLAISDTVRGVKGKPEQLYLDWHWSKAHRPRISLVHGLKDINNVVDRFNCYTHPALPGKQFCVDGISRNLRDGSAQIRMTEK